MDLKEKIARQLCKDHGSNPDDLEPGDLPCIDGYNKKEEPCHFRWRDFSNKAENIVQLVEQSSERVSVNAFVMGKSVIRILKDYNPSYKELIKIKEWVESEFQKSHKRSMEPEQTRFKETYP